MQQTRKEAMVKTVEKKKITQDILEVRGRFSMISGYCDRLKMRSQDVYWHCLEYSSILASVCEHGSVSEA